MVSGKRKKNRAIRFGWIIACGMVLVLFGVMVVLRLCIPSKNATAQREVQRRIDAIHKTGQPVSIKELAVRYPEPPPERDAVLLLKPALAAFTYPEDKEELPLFGGKWPEPDSKFSEETINAIRAFVDQNRKSIELVPRDDLKTAWVGAGFVNGFTNLAVVPISEMGALVRVLCLDAVLQATARNSKAAAQSLEKALLIAHTLKSDTILHGGAKGTWSKTSCESLMQVLSQTEISDFDLKSISDLLPEIEIGFSKELFVNERCFGLSGAEYFSSLANLARGRRGSIGDWWVGEYQARLIYRDQDLMEYLGVLDSYIAAMDLPLSNGIPKLAELDQSREKREAQFIAERSGVFGRLFPRSISLLSILSAPKGKHWLEAEGTVVASERAAKTAIAVERYRLSHAGMAPENLSALVPEFLTAVPKDPFDNQDLRFKKLQHGFMVYSIGPDFADDSGKPEPHEAKDSDHYDIVFFVAR